MLCKGLGWDMSIALCDLSLHRLNLLLSELFSRVQKTNGKPYPSTSLMNLMNGYNRIICRASDIRSLKSEGYLVDRDFNINSHLAFAKTRMVLKASITKSAQDGVNQLRQKVRLCSTHFFVGVECCTFCPGYKIRLTLFYLLSCWGRVLQICPGYEIRLKRSCW